MLFPLKNELNFSHIIIIVITPFIIFVFQVKSGCKIYINHTFQKNTLNLKRKLQEAISTSAAKKIRFCYLFLLKRLKIYELARKIIIENFCFAYNSQFYGIMHRLTDNNVYRKSLGNFFCIDLFILFEWSPLLQRYWPLIFDRFSLSSFA